MLLLYHSSVISSEMKNNQNRQKSENPVNCIEIAKLMRELESIDTKL